MSKGMHGQPKAGKAPSKAHPGQAAAALRKKLKRQ